MKKQAATLAAFFVIFCLFSFPVYAQDVPVKEKIVIVGDISQSLTDVGAEDNIENGLKLAVDLAPYDSAVSLITVDTEIKTETEFLDLSLVDNRAEVKNQIDSSTFTGGTNLVLGVERATEKLDGSPGRIIMLADISDYALTRASNFDEMTERAISLGEQAEKDGIVVDLILVGTPSENQALTKAYTSLPDETGGTLRYIKNSSEFPAAVEELFFSNFGYNIYPITGINSTDKEQQVDVILPTGNIARSRIYISATTPAEGIRATYAAAELGAEINSSYAMIDLDHPAQEGITLYLDTGENKTTKVYVIADYDMTPILTAESELVQNSDKGFIQKTTLDLSLLDSRSQSPLLTADEMDLFTPKLTITSPSGIEQQLDLVLNDTKSVYTTELYPEEYGSYDVTCNMSNGSYTFAVPIIGLNIPQTTPPKPTWLKPTLISVVVGLLLIAGAVLFYINEKKKKQAGNLSAVELDKTYEFTGKFYFSTILADGGKREIEPFTFYLEQVKTRKRFSLQEIYSASGQPDIFLSMKKIWITPGPRDSIIIKNNSDATILHSGKEYGYREKLQLFYNDKVFLIFKKDEDEIELYYKQTRPVRSNVTGSKISIAVS